MHQKAEMTFLSSNQQFKSGFGSKSQIWLVFLCFTLLLDVSLKTTETLDVKKIQTNKTQPLFSSAAMLSPVTDYTAFFSFLH